MIDVLLDPLVWIAGSLVFTLLINLFGRHCKRCFIFSTMTLGLLLLVATPGFANRWLATLENAYPLQSCDIETNTHPVVVLAGGLAGGYSQFAPAQRLSNTSKNRALAAAEVVKSDGALFIAGGRALYRRDVAEADAMEQFLRPMLAYNVTVITESDSENTYQNALNVEKLFEQMQLPKQVFLVTSAWHMRRAVGVFEKQGFEVCNYSVDPLLHIGVPLTTLWPQVSALNKTSLTIHEWVGWLYYRHQGYL